MRPKVSFFFMTTLVAGCIGVDYLEDPVVSERIDLSPSQIALMPGNTFKPDFAYYDESGTVKVVDNINWLSTDAAIASVNAEGVIMANAPGQAMITASYRNIQSNAINVNVVADANSVASVKIAAPGGDLSLNVGEEIQLAVSVLNINGEELIDRHVDWFSENSSIAIVDSEGRVKRINEGVVDIHAKSEHIKSNILTFGNRSGTFVKAGGYQAKGTAVLYSDDGDIFLKLEDDFETSFALGTFVYLANSTNAAQVKSQGLEVSQITSNGAKTFNLSSLKPNIGLEDYEYVVILCKPATVTFGYAQMN
jgi:hypothetical protein